MAVSLDGFAADRNSDLGALYPDFAALRRTATLQEVIRPTGGVVMGRGAYDLGDPDGWASTSSRSRSSS